MERAFVLFVVLLGVVKGAEWHYGDGEGGPTEWNKDYPLCDGKSQSPIDLDTDKAKSKIMLNPFKFVEYDAEGIDMTLSNNGHSAVVAVYSDEVMLMGGFLPGDFKLAQFHFHWGSDLWQGSEHTVDGKSYPAEMHLVHYNNKYADLATALPKPDGLAVLGIFMEAGDYDNSDYAPIINGLKDVIHEGESQSLSSFKLKSLLPEDVHTFYRYNGSLTTPTCDESVTWTVFKDTVKLSATQLQEFRNLMENPSGETDVTMVNNYRPVQLLNGREVWIMLPPNPPVAAGHHNLANIYLALVISIVAIFATC